MPETMLPMPPGAEDFKVPRSQAEMKEAPFPELNDAPVRPPIPLTDLDDELFRHLQEARRIGELSGREMSMLDLIEKMREHAFRDELTGLYNRKRWNREVEQETRSKNKGEAHVFVIDINDFKAFNGQYGHAGGDIVLQHIASVIGATVRENDMALRYAGDEFCVIARTNDPEEMAERMHDAVTNSPVEINGAMVSLTISLGIAKREDGDQDMQQTFNRADDALLNVAKAKKGETGLRTIGTYGEELPEHLKAKLKPPQSNDLENMNLGG